MAPAAFDPRPFIQSFEAAVDRLIAVRKDVQTKTEQMEKSVRVAEREYSKKMAELTQGFEVGEDPTNLGDGALTAGLLDCRELILWNGKSNERSQQYSCSHW